MRGWEFCWYATCSSYHAMGQRWVYNLLCVSLLYFYLAYWANTLRSAPENPIVRKNKDETRLKSHYFPFICCFFLLCFFFFFIQQDLCTFFFFFFNFYILNVIYDSNLRTRTGKRDQTNLWCPRTIYPSRGYS